MENKQKIKKIIGITAITLVAAGLITAGIVFTGKNRGNADPNNTVSPTPTITAEITPTPTEEPTPSPTPSPTPAPAFEGVKGLYLTPSTLSKEARLQHYAELADRTEINSYVIDLKGDDGDICYETNVPLAVKHKAWSKRYDIKKVIQKFREHDIHIIGRLVCFNDPLMPLKEPGMALKNKNGTVFTAPYKDKHLAWLDPSKPAAWEYIVDVAKEAVALGVDEIQFDYVRFPEITNYKYDMSHLTEEKSTYITKFIRYAQEKLPGVVISADIFGSICLTPTDPGGIGQTLEQIGAEIDYVSPMIYPSHFANDSKHYSGNGVGQKIRGVLFTKPDLDPYNVIYNSLLFTKERLEKAGLKTKVRPYLQGFTATYLPEGYKQEYNVKQYQEQIKAVYDVGYTEWLFWNASQTYKEDAFLPDNR